MKSEFSTGWTPIQKNSSSTPVRHQTELHQSNSHHLSHPLSHPPSPSSLLTPRTAAPTNRAISFAASFRSVFNRDRDRAPHRAASTNSLRSAYSASSSTKPPLYAAHADSSSLHPYAAMVAAPLPVVSSHDASDEEEECPVCLEPLSSSFRLPGEKPHIVPECGHALHEVSSGLPLPPPPPSTSASNAITVQRRCAVVAGTAGCVVFGSTALFPTSFSPLVASRYLLVVPGILHAVLPSLQGLVNGACVALLVAVVRSAASVSLYSHSSAYDARRPREKRFLAILGSIGQAMHGLPLQWPRNGV
ncbi:hypothetical protein BN946_scf184962.g35 [Trametes cinnabarina]|uniref:Uncharacterized protein n=1 Tax=Pycnoporus cinnabarinus TaxID=5643 RepID=A0A060SC53_PYCCI|nr:hypothetical protein BN946_scf184962.g35 [Trametes cinnabarina]